MSETTSRRVIVLSALLAASAIGQSRDVPYQQFADSYLATLGETGGASSELFPKLVDQHYLRLRVGAFDLRYPVHGLTGSRRAKALRDSVGAVLDVQAELVDWLGHGVPQRAELRKQFTLVRKWIKSWKPSKLLAAKGGVERDLLVVCAAPEPVAIAVNAWNEAFMSGSAVGMKEGVLKARQVIFAADRKGFMETACFLGSLREDNREVLWQSDLPRRCTSWILHPNPIEIVALEYAHPTQSGQDFTSGHDMNTREKNGLQQHVAQSIADTINRDLFPNLVDASFTTGFSQNLVIAVCGENNTRVHGDSEGRVAAARSVFVPGGNPNGGLLAPINLDSSWRGTKGRDHFRKPLQRGRKAGAKRTKDRKRRKGAFLLQSRDGKVSHVVHAPFLYQVEGSRPVPSVLLGELKEFYRAYSSCFVNWLRDRGGAKSKAASQAKFAELCRRLAARDTKDVAAAFVDVYGVALSEPSSTRSLEQQFLRWLGR